MGIIRRPEPVKLKDADSPVEEVVCVINESDDGNSIEIICIPEDLVIEDEPVEEVKAELKSQTVISSNVNGMIFGTWIPSLTASGTIDVVVRNAHYVKVGQLVTCTFDISINNMFGGKKDSSIILDNLPVGNALSGSTFISYFKVSNKEVRHISGTINGNNVGLWCQKRGQEDLIPLTLLDINVNSVLTGTVTYITNS